MAIAAIVQKEVLTSDNESKKAATAKTKHPALGRKDNTPPRLARETEAKRKREGEG